MIRNAFYRLEQLQKQLSPLRGADSPLLLANHFDTHLDEIAAITTDLHRLREVTSELNNLGGALELLLQLLDAAHNKQLDGGHLHCLLQPLVSKLCKAEDTLDAII